MELLPGQWRCSVSGFQRLRNGEGPKPRDIQTYWNHIEKYDQEYYKNMALGSQTWVRSPNILQKYYNFLVSSFERTLPHKRARGFRGKHRGASTVRWLSRTHACSCLEMNVLTMLNISMPCELAWVIF